MGLVAFKFDCFLTRFELFPSSSCFLLQVACSARDGLNGVVGACDQAREEELDGGGLEPG